MIENLADTIRAVPITREAEDGLSQEYWHGYGCGHSHALKDAATLAEQWSREHSTNLRAVADHWRQEAVKYGTLTAALETELSEAALGGADQGSHGATAATLDGRRSDAAGSGLILAPSRAKEGTDGR